MRTATQPARRTAPSARRPRWGVLLAAALLLPVTALAGPAAAAVPDRAVLVGAGDQPQRLMGAVGNARPANVHTVDEAVALMASSPDGPILPSHENADGVGPGSGLIVGGNGLCTAAYLLRSDVDGAYYLSTAGHCLMTSEDHAGPIDGTSPLAVQSVEICFRGCRFNWAAGLDEFLGLRGDYVLLQAGGGYQPVAFAQANSDDGQEDVGYDFGLIRIPAEAVPLLRPWLPQWGGPTAIEPTGLGFADTAVHFGHGTYCCPAVGGALTRSELDQGRVAQFNYGDEILFEAVVGWASGGDSGSPVGRGNPARLQSKGVLGDTAVGVLTHGLPNGSFFGTVYQQGLALASGTVGGLRLVTEDEVIASVQNSPPNAVADSADTTAGSPVTIPVLANDSDPDGDPLQVTGVGSPSSGTATQNPDGTVTYSPADGFTGTDTFGYTVSDGRGGTASAMVTVNVAPTGNRAPDAVDDTATTRRNQPTPIAVLSNDSDPDGDPLRVTSVTQPEHGKVKINDDGTVTYQAQGQYTGQDRFSYTIDDGRGGTDTAEVLVTVQQPGNGREER